ncbi:tyrosine-protein phosphatase [Pseudonocardia sp. CA-107938]|uniref:tyrosine-protein phosphatase n=1 Tax=Pseudonocardia sp. CA-107938 TaxID=3240021 RepID=UPI003D93C433
MTDPVNLRDVRGLRTGGGRIVRRGALYRSEAPRSAAGPDVAVWPPAHVIDLRAPEERTWAHPLDGPSTVHQVPLGRSLAPALAEQTDEPDLAWAYRLLAKDAADEIAGIIRLVAHSPGPVLVHCTAGKDRTGIVVAVLLRAVGVTRRDVVADYLRTADVLPQLWAALGTVGVPHPRNPALLGVQADAIEAVLDELDGHPDGVAGWLSAHEVPAADLDLLRVRLLAP